MIIPPDFASNVRRGQANVLVLVDGSELFTSLSAYNTANLIGQAHATRAALQKIERSGMASIPNPLDVHLNILYNPDFKDLWFIIPGIIALLLQTQTIVLTATSVVREREVGTIEQILVTPIRPMELMLGKIAPNIVLIMINVLTILAIAVFWFKVPFQGSFWLFMSLTFLYAFSGLGLGLLISTVSQNNRQTMQLVMFISLLSVTSADLFSRAIPCRDPAGDRQPVPTHLFCPHHTRSHHQGNWSAVPGRRNPGPGGLHPGDYDHRHPGFPAEAGLICWHPSTASPPSRARKWLNCGAIPACCCSFSFCRSCCCFLFAYAVTLTVDHLPTAVADQSHDERSRDFIQTLVNSGYFDQTLVLQNEQELVQALNSGQVKAGILIPTQLFRAGLPEKWPRPYPAGWVGFLYRPIRV